MILTAALIWLQQIAAGHSVSVIAFVLAAFGYAVLSFIKDRNRQLLLACLVIAAGFSSLFQLEIPRQASISGAIEANKTVATTFIATSDSAKFGSEKRTWIKISKLDETELRPAVLGALITDSDFDRGGSYQAALSLDEPWDLQRGHFNAKLVGESIMLSPPRAEVAAIASLRLGFMDSLSGLTPDSAALVAGLAIGERESLTPETAESMRVVALTHLIAVSGANCAIVMGAVYFLLAGLNLGRRWRLIGASLALLGYIALVGPEPSVLRAGVMAFSVIAAMASGRKIPPINALAFSIVVLLIIDPWLATDFAFALSVFSTLGILVLAPLIYQRLKDRMLNWLAVGLAVTFAAQLYCIPVLLMLQPELPLYGLIANLLAEPAVAPVTIIGISAVLVSAISPQLASLMSFIASIGTAWIEFLAITFSSMPAASVAWVPGVAGIVLAILVAIAITFVFVENKTQRVIAVSILGAISSFGAWQFTNQQIRQVQFANSSQEIIQCDVGQGDALVIRSQGKVALIDVGREPQLIKKCLYMLGHARLDLLFLTHYDLDHVGGISGLEGIDIGNVFVSGFADDRPAVELVSEAIAKSEATLRVGSRGTSGSLGDFDWQILAPSSSASEASDSNDASLIVVFESEERVILTLGDIGEAGQERLMRSGLVGEYVDDRPLVLKVSHHGSADQSASFHQLVDAEIALISVGDNSYGHPTNSAISMLKNTGAKVLTTKDVGHISITGSGQLSYSVSAKLSM